MPEEYGSPKANDRIARLEAVANSVYERVQGMNKELEKVFPRATGSKPRDPTLEAVEYATSIADDPEGWKTLIGQWRGQGYNFRQIIDEAKKYTERNEKKLASAMPTKPPPAGNELMPPAIMGSDGTDAGSIY